MPVAETNQTVAVKIPGLARQSTVGVELLKKHMPWLKLVIVVKDPISRIVSHIIHEFKNSGGLFFGLEMPDINDIIMDRIYIPNLMEIPNYGGP